MILVGWGGGGKKWTWGTGSETCVIVLDARDRQSDLL